ncbi:MAG: hypothetical protein K6G90_10600 [Clostridia bacterium]|nr:hypothetical protein [Clostridia bacterium]
MNFDFSMIFELIKKLVLFILEKYEVLKEFDALGVDIVGLLNGATDTTETTSQG